MPRSKWTVMVLPHDHERVKSIHISTAGVRVILWGFLLSLLLVGVLTVGFFVKQSQHAQVLDLREALADSEGELGRSRFEVEQLQSQVLDQAVREDEITELEARYAELAELVAGQEQIARIHRDILARRTVSERLLDAGYGLVVGILATIIAEFLFLRPRVVVAPNVGDALSDLYRDVR